MTVGLKDIAVESRELRNFKSKILLRPNSDWDVLYVVGKPWTRATKPSKWLGSNRPETNPEMMNSLATFSPFFFSSNLLLYWKSNDETSIELKRMMRWRDWDKFHGRRWPEKGGMAGSNTGYCSRTGTVIPGEFTIFLIFGWIVKPKNLTYRNLPNFKRS